MLCLTLVFICRSCHWMSCWWAWPCSCWRPLQLSRPACSVWVRTIWNKRMSIIHHWQLLHCRMSKPWAAVLYCVRCPTWVCNRTCFEAGVDTAESNSTEIKSVIRKQIKARINYMYFLKYSSIFPFPAFNTMTLFLSCHYSYRDSMTFSKKIANLFSKYHLFLWNDLSFNS